MISPRNKSLFATVVMAISLARAAPLQDNAGPTEAHLIEAVPEHHPVIDGLGNRSMYVPSPTGIKEHHHGHHHSPHHHSNAHQTQVVPDGEDYAAELSDEIPTNGEELAQHVINLRDYIDTLSEDDFDDFLDHYMENAGKDDMFALELALDLDADDEDAEDDYSYIDPWDAEDDDETIKFVPYSQVKQGPTSHHRHHRQRLHNHRRQRQLEEEVGCDEEEIAMGLCEPSIEYSRHPRHHRSGHDRQHHQDIEEELMCGPAEFEEGLCGPRHHHHHQRHHHQPHLRHGEVIEKETYELPAGHHPHHAHQVMTKADGFPFGENLGHLRRHQYQYDADLLGLPEVHHSHASHKPFHIRIIESAASVPMVTVTTPESVDPVKVAKVHIHQQHPSLTPRAVDEVSSNAETV